MPEASTSAGDRIGRWVRRLPSLDRLVEHEASRLLAAGVLIGVLGGVAAGLFDRGMIAVGDLVLANHEPASGPPVWWRALLGPAICGLVAGVVIAFGAVRRRPQSVPDVMERVRLDAPALTLRDGLASAVAAAFVVGGGQSGGREGPIVQVASTFAAEVCRFLQLPPQHFRTLVAAGAAAGVAASFNTPVGGAFFALEIILGDWGVDSFAPVVAATVTGTVVGQALLGDRIALALPTFSLKSPLELPFYLLLGGVSGVVAVGFKRAMATGAAELGKLPIPTILRPAAAGLAVGVVAALGMNEVMGNGYHWMELSISDPGQLSFGFLSALLVVKIAATTITGAGRGGAGIFAPSLYLGAVTGLLVGKFAAFVAPSEVASVGAFGMVGMGAVGSGVLHAPITMTLMLFEMTGNYQVILPLLVALASAGMVSRWLGAESIYEAELRHRGVSFHRRPPNALLGGLAVADVMRDDEMVTAGVDESLQEVVRRFLGSPGVPIFVLDAERVLQGTIQLQAATAALFRTPAARVADQVASDVPSVRADDALGAVVPLFFHARCDALPVVDAAGRLVGVLHERDVVAAYHRFLLQKDTLLARFDSGPRGARTTDFVELPEGYALDVVRVDDRLAGRTLRDLGLPENNGCMVVAHSVWDGSEGRWHRRPADPRRVLESGDRLVVIGPSGEVSRLAANA